MQLPSRGMGQQLTTETRTEPKAECSMTSAFDVNDTAEVISPGSADGPASPGGLRDLKVSGMRERPRDIGEPNVCLA